MSAYLNDKGQVSLSAVECFIYDSILDFLASCIFSIMQGTENSLQTFPNLLCHFIMKVLLFTATLSIKVKISYKVGLGRSGNMKKFFLFLLMSLGNINPLSSISLLDILKHVSSLAYHFGLSNNNITYTIQE